MFQPTLKSFQVSSETIIVRSWADALAIAVMVLIGTIAVFTFRDYGLGWDDYTQSQYGDLLLSLYSSGFTDKRALSFVNVYMYGGGFDMLAALAAKVLPFGLFETRRLVGAAIGLIGLFATWRVGRRLGGPLAGLIALILLAACPLYYGHMFMNSKDGPFAAAMAIALLGIVRAFAEYPRATPATVALCGIGVGLAIGSRVLGGYAVVDVVLVLGVVLWVRARRTALKPALAECGSFVTAFIPGVVLAYLVMGLVWPWSVVDPLNLLRAVKYFSYDFEKPWRELFDGRLILITQMPRSYVPTLIALQLPELMLGLGLCGIAIAANAVFQGSGKRADNLGWSSGLLACAIAALLPLVVTIIAQPYVYNGIRHMVFVLPPLAVLGGVAGALIARHLEARGRVAMAAGAILLGVGVVSPVADMVRLHPYEYSDFNHIAGGVVGARPRFMLDYWGLSLTQASRSLRRWIAERNDAPAGGKWRVAVCGPHPPVSVALGPQYSLAWDPKGADFAMMLGEFYCAKLNAPVVAEVVRSGVVYARVYDIRGRSIPSLLATPGIGP